MKDDRSARMRTEVLDLEAERCTLETKIRTLEAVLAEERHDCDRLAEALRLYYLAAGRPDREVEALLADHAKKRGGT